MYVSSSNKRRRKPKHPPNNGMTYHIREDISIWHLHDHRSTVHDWIVHPRARPCIVVNHIEAFDDVEFSTTGGAHKIISTPNAGGNSIFSEAISFEILSFMCSAILRCTEMEISYMPGSKITDFFVSADGHDFAVSVTRAMKYYNAKTGYLIFTEEDAYKLLNKKLNGVIESTHSVLSHTWDKQVLHVLVQHEYMIDILWDVYERMIDERTKCNTLVMLSMCKGIPRIFSR